jgi:hypothetical protein
MRMKHRWIGIAALAATLTLGACAPTDQGADEESASPASTAGESPEGEPSASSTPYVMDDY